RQADEIELNADANVYINESVENTVKNINGKDGIAEHPGELSQQSNPVYDDARQRAVLVDRDECIPPTKHFSRTLIEPVVVSLILRWACGSSDRKSEEQDCMQARDSSSSAAPRISEEAIGDILQRIPSPLEISVLLKESGRKYDVGILNDPNNLSKYNTNYKRALNLGVYGTDLGYTNIYEQNQDGLKYIASIKSLGDGLNIGQFFDVETIGRLAANSRNLDSLLLITTQNFNSINAYLQNQNRANLSVLLLTGGWVEALHITCAVAQD